MPKTYEYDAIILSTTFKEKTDDIIKFLKLISTQCSRIKNEFNVYPVIVFEKNEDYKFKKVKTFFENAYFFVKPIILLNTNGCGFSSCLNYGINNTNSKWIIRLDTDDLLKEERILSQLKLMEKENLDMSSGYMEDQNGNILKYPKSNLDLITKICLGMNPFAHPSICIKKDSLNILYDTSLDRCEDFELWINLLSKRDFKWKCIGSPITIYSTERSKIKDKENGKMQIQLRLKYGVKFFLMSFILLIGIIPNFLRIILSNNLLLNIRRKLN